jgi:spermidine synthase
MTVPALRRLLMVCFGASGAAALIYQVAWVRLLTLALGHTVAAASTVLAAFMGGLAIGAWAAGRVSVGITPTLARYAALELFIAVAAIALPAVLSGFDPLLIRAYADGTAPASFATARVAVSFLLIGVPAAAMGATYPLAVDWLARLEGGDTRDTRSISTAGGTLYAANSAGAAAGAMAAGFWLIEVLGIRGTTWVGVALNVLAASLALWCGRTGRWPSTTLPVAPRSRRAKQPERNTSRPQPALAAVAAALSGFVALVYEVTWTRLLALTLGPTTYAFATMAASFIAGIALGSSLGVRLARRSSRVTFWLGAMLVATAVSTILAASFTASRLPLVIARDVATYSDFGSLFLRQALAIVALLLPASVSLGATFTLALAAASTAADSAARQTAHVYAANTFGAVAGALAAGFLFVPRFGLQTTFLYASAVLLVAGSAIAAFASTHPGNRRLNPGAALPLLAGGAAVIIAFGIGDWDRDLITSGAYKYARQLSMENLESSLRAGRLDYYREGAAGTVSVRSVAGSRSLAIDGKVDASNGADMLTQRLLGLLPTMLHTGPRDALVIGLGSGVTADAVLASAEVRNLDVVEISPEVVEASAYFARENHDVLRKPAVRLLVGDGRSHLRLSARQYDVIISEPSNPWMAGVSALFTREFFEAARARLRSGGIFCQWSHTYEIADRDLQSIVRTFASVFPDGTMWLVGEGDLLLIGSVEPGIDGRLAAVPARSAMGSVPALLAGVGIPATAAPFVLFSMFAGGPRELKLFGSDALLQTDDRMALEFSAARAMHAPPAGQAERLRALAAGVALPGAVSPVIRHARAGDWAALGDTALRAEAFAAAHDSFRRATSLDSRSARALRGSSEAAAGMRKLAEEAEWLKQVAAAEPANAAARVELSHVAATLGDAETAVAAALDAVSIDPSSPAPLEQLASVFADLGDTARLTPAADELIRRFPERSDGRYYRAAALFLEERPADAERATTVLLRADPRHAKGLNLLGVICASRGDRECARKSFMQSLDVNPRDPSVYVNLGKLSLESGDTAAAAEFFGEALTIDPNDQAAMHGIADARGRAGGP